jgi:hypothetical protein
MLNMFPMIFDAERLRYLSRISDPDQQMAFYLARRHITHIIY